MAKLGAKSFQRGVCWLAAATVLVSGLLASSVCSADVIAGDFTIKDGAASASGGTVVFSLNLDGTISASLSTTGGLIAGFGFNSVAINLPESNFSPSDEPLNTFGWIDMYGYHHSGFAATGLHTSITWTIGNPGDFSSVSQAIGGSDATSDFFLITADGAQWAANSVSVVPEPGSLALLGLGCAVLAASRRRKK